MLLNMYNCCINHPKIQAQEIRKKNQEIISIEVQLCKVEQSRRQSNNGNNKKPY